MDRSDVRQENDQEQGDMGALFNQVLDRLGEDDPELRAYLPRHRVYDVSEVEQMYAQVDSMDNEKRRRIKKILEPMRDPENMWKRLSMLPGRDWDVNLRHDFPHFSAVLDHLETEFALAALGDQTIRSAPILLLGDPGIGKSYFLRCLAESLQMAFEEVHFETASAGWILAGVDMTWSGGRQGKVFDILTTGKFANPIVLLDEIDKVGSEQKYDPLGSLYALLERHSAQYFQDEAIAIPLDASRIIWAATANRIETIPAPLVSRFTVFHISSPTLDQATAVAQSVYQTLLKTEVWGRYFEDELNPDVARKVAFLPPREMRKALWSACGRAAKREVRQLELCDIVIGQKPGERQKIGFC